MLLLLFKKKFNEKLNFDRKSLCLLTHRLDYFWLFRFNIVNEVQHF